jgi:hypothetical protein
MLMMARQSYYKSIANLQRHLATMTTELLTSRKRGLDQLGIACRLRRRAEVWGNAIECAILHERHLERASEGHPVAGHCTGWLFDRVRRLAALMYMLGQRESRAPTDSALAELGVSMTK